MNLLRLFLRAGLAALVVVLGCEVTDTLVAEVDFGDPYRVAYVTSPPGSPALDAAGLHVTVQFSGGCQPHDFTVHFRVRGSVTELWLRHDGHGDTCEAYLTETLTRSVPMRVLDTERVRLLTPGGGTIDLR